MGIAIEGWVGTAGTILEICGIGAIVVGVAVSVGAAIGATRRQGAERGFVALRQTLGRAILLGLELLVAADIVRSVSSKPAVQDVLVLALIVVIRTFLSVTLQVELEGRWPWQRSREGPGPRA